MGIANWGYTSDQSLGVFRCSWYTADEAEAKLVLMISAIYLVIDNTHHLVKHTQNASLPLPIFRHDPLVINRRRCLRNL